MALPRLETIGFQAAVHKPLGDVTDVTSISFIQSMVLVISAGTPTAFGAEKEAEFYTTLKPNFLYLVIFLIIQIWQGG